MPKQQFTDTCGQSFQLKPQECRDILANVPMGIFTSEPEGRFIGVNMAMAQGGPVCSGVACH